MNNETEDQVCYICLEKVEKHIPVCQCQKVCHLKCLHQWITDDFERNNQDKCDICQQNYIDLKPYFKETTIIPTKVIILSLIGLLIIFGVASYWIYGIISQSHQWRWDILGICIALSVTGVTCYLLYQHYFTKNIKKIIKIIEDPSTNSDNSSEIIEIENDPLLGFQNDSLLES